MKRVQGVNILLNYEDDRLAEVIDLPATFAGGILVEILIDIGKRGWMWIAGVKSDTHGDTVLRVTGATDEALINPLLGLFPQVVVNTCNHNDEFVTCIGSFRDNAHVVGGFT